MTRLIAAYLVDVSRQHQWAANGYPRCCQRCFTARPRSDHTEAATPVANQLDTETLATPTSSLGAARYRCEASNEKVLTNAIRAAD